MMGREERAGWERKLSVATTESGLLDCVRYLGTRTVWGDGRRSRWKQISLPVLPL